MIQITSTLSVQEEHSDEALRLSVAHVERSRGVAGCIRHEVFVDPQTPTRLFFSERWRDQTAIDAHFREPASLAFVAKLQELAVSPPSLAICTVSDEQERHLGVP